MVAGIAKLIAQSKIGKYARDVFRETRARDLTLDDAAKVDDPVSPTPVAKADIPERNLAVYTETEKVVSAADTELLKIQEAVKKNPLTMGGASVDNELKTIGSGLYDFIAMRKDNAPKRAEEWANILRAKMDYTYLEPRTGTMRTMQVKRQEAADANIAIFNRQGDLVGGILKNIIENPDASKVRLTKQTLLTFIKNSPTNNIRVIKTGSAYAKKQADVFVKDIETYADKVRDSYDFLHGKNVLEIEKTIVDLTKKLDVAEGNGEIAVIQDRIKAAKKVKKIMADSRQLSGGLQQGIANGEKGGVSGVFDQYSNNLLKGMVTTARSLGNIFDEGTENLLAKGNSFTTLFNPQSYRVNNELFKRDVKGRNIAYPSKYANAYNGDYRLKGSEDYFEDMLYIDNSLIERLPPDLKQLYTKTHYGADPAGKELLGNLFHIRGGTRSVRGGGKALVIDEMQSDPHQTIARGILEKRDKYVDEVISRIATPGEVQRLKKIKKEAIDKKNPEIFYQDKEVKKIVNDFYSVLQEKRRNPFNEMNVNTLINKDELLDIGTKMRTIASKGRYQTPDQRAEFKKLADRAEYLRTSVGTQVDFKSLAPDEVTYLPMPDNKEWTGLGLKYLIKKAAENGQQYVAINPFEMVAYKRPNDRRIGLLQEYGNYRGQGYANKLELGSSRRGSSKVLNSQVRKNKAGEEELIGPIQATLPSLMREFAKKYGLPEPKPILISKSDPNKPFKRIKRVKNYDVDAGKEINFDEHTEAYESLEHATQTDVSKLKFIDGNSDDNYYLAYALKITPDMKDIPLPTYKRGGLVVDLFKWS